jgi:hypothetical protein
MVSLPLECHQGVLDLGHTEGNIASPAMASVSRHYENNETTYRFLDIYTFSWADIRGPGSFVPVEIFGERLADFHLVFRRLCEEASVFSTN